MNAHGNPWRCCSSCSTVSGNGNWNGIKIVRNGEPFLEDEQARALKKNADMFLLHYNWLANHAVENGRRNWIVQYKHHHFWHIAYAAWWCNPKILWCYDFEDFMGVLCTSARSSLAGSPMRIVGGKIIENFTLVFELTLRQCVASSFSGQVLE